MGALERIYGRRGRRVDRRVVRPRVLVFYIRERRHSAERRTGWDRRARVVALRP